MPYVPYSPDSRSSVKKLSGTRATSARNRAACAAVIVRAESAFEIAVSNPVRLNTELDGGARIASIFLYDRPAPDNLQYGARCPTPPTARGLRRGRGGPERAGARARRPRAPISDGVSPRGGAAQRCAPPHTAMEAARRGRRSSAATRSGTSRRRSRQPHEHRRGAPRKREPRRSAARTPSRTQRTDRQWRSRSYHPYPAFGAESFTQIPRHARRRTPRPVVRVRPGPAR
jgi:hypothetical protein